MAYIKFGDHYTSHKPPNYIDCQIFWLYGSYVICVLIILSLRLVAPGNLKVANYCNCNIIRSVSNTDHTCLCVKSIIIIVIIV